MQRVQNGEGCVFVSTLCMYDLFVLSWVKVRRVCLGSVSSVVFTVLLFCEVFCDYGGVLL